MNIPSKWKTLTIWHKDKRRVPKGMRRFNDGDNMGKIIHPIKPLYNENSRILILGSFPSVKSREQMFFYGHPQNRFWSLAAKIFSCEVPKSVDEKKKLALKHGIAMWDVISSCEIEGSADSSIKNVKANDLSQILEAADIKSIYVNGKTAEKYYNKLILPKIGRATVCLPSTSPANAAYSLDKLYEAWKIIREDAIL